MNKEYRLRKTAYYPKGAEQRGPGEGAYLGVSLNNALSRSSSAMKDVCLWMTRQFGRFEILVGDSVHRHNLLLDGTLTESESVTRSVQEAEELISFIDLVAKENQCSNFSYLMCQSFHIQTGFRDKVNYFTNLIENRKDIQSIIELTTDKFLSRKYPSLLMDRKARSHSFKYQVEELAIFEMLAEEGRMVNVYPGRQLPIMIALVEGRLGHFSPVLEKLTLVELQMVPKF